jgi:hypothetical protein
MDRRDMLKAITGASAAIAGMTGDRRALAAPGSTSPFASLTGQGLDPLDVYRRMFATADGNAGCYWCFAGALPVEIDEVGTVSFVQEETFRAQKTEDAGKDGFYLDWREAGVFRDIETGEVAKSFYNPDTAKRAELGHLHHDPARFTVRRNGDGIALMLDTPGITVQGITVAAAIIDDRVSLTQTEYKLNRNIGAKLQCATLKIYSSLAALKGRSPSVAAQGFYSVRIVDTGKTFVSGLMQKAAPDEKINPLAWDRIRAIYPEFFDGDRIQTRWG